MFLEVKEMQFFYKSQKNSSSVKTKSNHFIDRNLNIKILQYSHVTRGPKEPWVAHLRKRSKVTVEPFTEDY